MVGVPGRSKGCATCRKRKKGCDLARPACGQCVRARLSCGGYERETVFVHTMDAKGRGAQRYSVATQREATMSAAGRGSADDPEGAEAEHGPRTGSGVAGVAALAPDITLSDTLARSSYEQLYAGTFWTGYLPQGRALTPAAAQYTTGVWMNALQRTGTSIQEPALRKIFLALCLASAGRQEQQPGVTAEGLKYYVSSLQDAKAALAHPRKGTSDALWITSRLFSLYEVLFGHDEKDKLGQARSWQGHQKGELAIVAARPPETFVSGYSHQLFVDGRLHQTTAAVQARKGTILSRQEWKTIPWREVPKTPKDILLDIFVEIPAVLEEFDDFRSCTDITISQSLHARISRHCHVLDGELTAWRAKYGRDLEDAIFDPPQNSDGQRQTDTEANNWSVDLLAKCHTSSAFCTTSILLKCAIHQLAHPDSLPDMRIYCRMITRLVAVFLDERAGAYGLHLANFPMAVALIYLHASEPGGGPEWPEKLALIALFKSSGRGQIVEKFLSSLQQRESSPDIAMEEGAEVARRRAKLWFGLPAC